MGHLASTGLKHEATPAAISSCWLRRKKHTGETFIPHGVDFACGQIEAGMGREQCRARQPASDGQR